jgi:hypothetical protein
MWVKNRMSVYDEWKEDMSGNGPVLFHVLPKKKNITQYTGRKHKIPTS